MLKRQDNGKHPVGRFAAGAFLLCLLTAAPAGAQYSGYTPNPDTAPDRRDGQMGTGGRTGGPKGGQDPVTGDFYMETAPRPRPQDEPQGNQTFDVDVLYPGVKRGKK